MKRMFRRIKKIVERIIFCFFSFFPLNENRILFESEGDLSDNAYAFYDYLINNEFDRKYQLIWLTEPSFSCKGISTIPKWVHGVNLKRLFIFATTKYFIFDHNNVLSEYPRRKNQIIVNLFHGCTFKGAKGGAEVKNTEDVMLVTSDFWKPIMSRFIPCDINKIVSLGYPRNDYLFHNKNNRQVEWMKKNGWDKFCKIFLWMPTFRKSNSALLSEDYYSGITGLPLLERLEDLDELNTRLNQRNDLMVIKIHHLQMEYPVFNKKYSNIQILKDDNIIKDGLQLYQVVALTDVLITDYSSISNDYLLLNQPMIFTLDDYDQYRKYRGFSVEDPKKYFPGYHVFKKTELTHAIEEISNGKDIYLEERKKLLPLMHKYQDENSSRRIVEFLNL